MPSTEAPEVEVSSYGLDIDDAAALALASRLRPGCRCVAEGCTAPLTDLILVRAGSDVVAVGSCWDHLIQAAARAWLLADER